MKLERSQSRAELLRLGLPPAVVSIFDGELPHPALGFRCAQPGHIFSADPESLGIHATPLWECGVVVTAHSGSVSGDRFVRFSLEAPAEVFVLGSRFDCVAADLLITLWEDDEPKATLLEVAEILSFRPAKELIALCGARSKAKIDSDHETWLRTTLALFDRAA